MATILRRTALLEVDSRAVLDGATLHRPCDWAIVQTTLGTMVEPFTLFAKHATGTETQNYDSSEELRRVDEIKTVSLDSYMKLLSGGGDTPLHGGHTWPRTGR